MTVAVLPRPVALRVQNAPSGEIRADGFFNTPVPLPRQDFSVNFRDLREYRPGDPARAIHWKQSVRTDQLLVREYEREADYFFILDLPDFENIYHFHYSNITKKSKLSPEYQDAYFQILSAIILGLLQNASAVRVRWRDNQQIQFLDISGESDRREFFRRVYSPELKNLKSFQSQSQNYKSNHKNKFNNFKNQNPFPSVPNAFQFYTDLRWSRDNHFIHQFSHLNFQSEIADQIFYI